LPTLNVADGHVLKDNESKIGADGHFKVRVGTRWFDVPPQLVRIAVLIT